MPSVLENAWELGKCLARHRDVVIGGKAEENKLQRATREEG
jgi:hypothetical protein